MSRYLVFVLFSLFAHALAADDVTSVNIHLNDNPFLLPEQSAESRLTAPNCIAALSGPNEKNALTQIDARSHLKNSSGEGDAGAEERKNRSLHGVSDDSEHRMRPDCRAPSIFEMASNKLYVHEAKQTKLHGYTLSDKFRIKNYSDYVNQFRDYQAEFLRRNYALMEKLDKDSLKAKSKRIRATNFAPLFTHENAEILFDLEDGDYYPGKGWDSATLILETKKLGILIFIEWDFSMSGGGVVIDRDAINMDINGHPAILIIRQVEGGPAETVLSWADATKSYTLQFNRNAFTAGVLDDVMELAQSISPIQR